jgi:hypothetical protein
VAFAVDGLVAPVPEGWDLADAAPGMEGRTMPMPSSA